METGDQKQRFLEVGIELIASKGYTGTSIRDIANALNTSISNIYHYFGSKEGLLVGILEYLSAKLVAGMRSILDETDEPLEGLCRLVKLHLGLSVHNLAGARIFLLDAEHFSPEGNRISRRIQLEVLGIYVEQLKRLREAGLIRQGNLKIMAFNILACINWQIKWFRPNGPLTAEEVQHEILEFVLNGILSKKDHHS